MRRFESQHPVHSKSVQRMISQIIVFGLFCLPVACMQSELTVPNDVALKKITQTTMLDFALAIKAKDFSAFRGRISEAWKEQISTQQFNDSFKVFWEKNIDLTIIDGHQPTYSTKPRIDSDEMLVLEGTYQVPPLAIDFNLKYTWEDGWKLFGIHVNALPLSATSPDSAGIPSQDKLVQLTQATMLDFALAIKASDFTAFYHKIASFWKAQTTKEELAQIFQAFTEQNIDLTVLQDMTPQFQQKPFLDANGWLILNGSYETQPSRVTFELKYLVENEDWRLVGINVNVK